MKNTYQHGDISWWQHDRFGMFIHWGVYSVPARGEWVHTRGSIMPEDYQRYAEFFTPDKFEPAKWANAAKAAGMKYVVFTAKHHDGYCMWNTAYTDYKAERDYVREIVDAFRAEGLRIGLYYSLLDWHHPDFLVDRYHPLRDQDREALNKNRDQKRYCQYMRNQVRELLTNYGKIDIMWFDFTYPFPDGKCAEDWEAEELLALIRSLAPEIIIDDRMGLPGAGDFVSPEQYVPHHGLRGSNGELLPWEGCQTFSGAWGYNRDETTWKTPHQLINLIVSHVAKGGNILLNVGPDARGNFPPESMERLKAIGNWMKCNSRSIYGCGKAGIEKPDYGRVTRNGSRLYFHIYENTLGPLPLMGLKKEQIQSIRWLATGAEIKLSTSWVHSDYPEIVFANLGENPVLPDAVDTVIEVTLK